MADPIQNIRLVMPGLVPGTMSCFLRSRDVDGRDKPGHDAFGVTSAAVSTPPS
jgi:hypothetical protein